MDFGVSYFPTDEAVEPAELARMCEQRGFESFFVTEHTHIPASRETPYPAGGELPREGRIEALQELAEEAGRGRIPVTLQIPPKDPERIAAYETAGVTRVVHMLRASDAAGHASAEAKLDEWAERMAAYRGAGD